MLSWSITFLIIGLIAGVLGLSGIAGAATQIAWILFVVFLILFVVSFIMGPTARLGIKQFGYLLCGAARRPLQLLCERIENSE
jgi:uncharacterized membrane protein YtjA (UPF0391 family)